MGGSVDLKEMLERATCAICKKVVPIQDGRMVDVYQSDGGEGNSQTLVGVQFECLQCNPIKPEDLQPVPADDNYTGGAN